MSMKPPAMSTAFVTKACLRNPSRVRQKLRADEDARQRQDLPDLHAYVEAEHVVTRPTCEIEYS